MSINKLAKAVILSSAIVGLVGCASKGSNMASNQGNQSPVRTAGVGDVSHFYGEAISPEEEQALLDKQVLYFGFDKFDVSEENKRVLFAHAKKLIENPELRLRVDGHTDERGSREYNVALGERRAQAVARVLALKGISANRVVSVSYGKEQPVSLGHDESSWGMNRRAELHYEDQS